MPCIDLNADVGEGFGVYSLGNDERLLEIVSSANIACGFHAGDPTTMRRTVQLALARGVAIGAHPGLPDRVGFGRRAMAVSPDEAYAMVVYQIGALAAFVTAAGGTLQHVKPHGALYNMAAASRELAGAIAQAVADIDRRLVLVGLAGSQLIEAGNKLGLRTASEIFADRAYQPDGTLAPRGAPGALLTDPEKASQQVLKIIRGEPLPGFAATRSTPTADTVCIHGDTPQAISIALHVRQSLAAAGIAVKSLVGCSP
jgi:UPF0271 protein